MHQEIFGLIPGDWHLTSIQVAIIAAFISSSLFTLVLQSLRDQYRLRRLFHGWQAIFLSNNDVYFGKIKNINHDDITLIKVYYLRSEKETITPQNVNFKRSRVQKLGGEIHAPEDAMIINRSQILFIENLKDTAPIVKDMGKVDAVRSEIEPMLKRINRDKKKSRLIDLDDEVA
jgi:hypothetical protein